MTIGTGKTQVNPTTKNKATSPSPLLKGGAGFAGGGLSGAAGADSFPGYSIVTEGRFLPRNKALIRTSRSVEC